MDGVAEAEQLEQGRDAASAGDWSRAFDLLVQADQHTGLTVDDLGLLAEVAYAAGHLDVTIVAWERAHAEAVRAGDSLAAADAATRVALHLLMDTALMAPIRGWVRRAERLLEGHDDSPAHAWLALIKSYDLLMRGDLPAARDWATRAIAVGSIDNPPAAAIGRVAEAHAVILAGQVRHGLDLVEEAGVAAISGELDAVSTGMLYCELVCMLQGLGQYDLAAEWTEAMERWSRASAIGSAHGRCRVHRAEILRLRGATAEAEQEALAACAELRPYLRREFGWPLTELGRIRLQQGDLQGAEEAFTSAREAGWDPEPGLAQVRLARGDVALAAAAIHEALDHPLTVPSKELPPNTDLRRAPLLAARVEIDIADGNLVGARAAADELSQVAAAFQSRALAAGAAMADGRVMLAAGDLPAARHGFEAAIHLWSLVGAPHEVALARTGLAQAHPGAGVETPKQVAPPSPVTWNLDEPRGPNVFRRDGDYWTISFDNQTVALRDLKGMQYLARLLAQPGREFHVLDLVAGGATRADTSPGTPDLELHPGGGDSGVLLDAQAKAAYRRRLGEIDEDIEEARLLNDSGRLVQAETERDFLIRELSRAVGLGERTRRAGSAPERARVSVTRAIRYALSRIRHHHPPLGEHLDRAIRTGVYCVYLPDSRNTASWRT
jgi:tetratricopeptide (TPR) repeat protein